MSNYIHIESWWKIWHEMADIKPNLGYIVTEKLDGANFSILCRPDGFYSYRSKNQELTNSNRGTENSDFGMFGDAIKLANQIVAAPLKMAKATNQTVVLYFEFYGGNIQKKIKYNVGPWHINDKTLCFIDAAFKVDEANNAGLKSGNHGDEWWWLELLVPQTLADYDECFKVVPIPKSIFIPKLDAALIERIRNSQDEFSWTKGTEGVVIRPTGRNRDRYGQLLQTKVKTLEYEKYEKRGGQEHKPAKDPAPSEIIDYVFDTLNFGRLHSIYSHGHENLERKMSDMRYLPSLAFEDIKDEGHEIFAKHPHDVIQKVISKRLPHVLKGFLAQ